MTAQHAVLMENLSKKFGGKSAVSRIACGVHTGEIFGIVGPDDAGKTTLLRMIAGILEPTEGSIHILGVDALRHKEEVIPEIGYLAQIFSLYADLTVRENLDFFGKIFSIPEREYSDRAREMLKFSNLERFENRLAGNLSGGMKKKLSVVCALIHRPKILVMDEPTIGVDPVTRRELWRMFYTLRQEGITVIVSTSYMDEAELCSRVGYMYKGEFIMLDSPQNIKREFTAGVWYIDGKPRETIKTVLSGFGEKTAWAPFGLQFHLYDDSGSLSGDNIEQRLRDAKCTGIAVKKIPVSVEDVFVKKLQEMEDRNHGVHA